MAITFVQQRKYQKYLILIFIVLIAVIAFVFFGDYLKKGEEVFISNPTAAKHLPPVRIDFQVLDNPIFQKLTEPFPDLPPAHSLGEVGRENPFLPYEGQVGPSEGGASE